MFQRHWFLVLHISHLACLTPSRSTLNNQAVGFCGFIDHDLVGRFHIRASVGRFHEAGKLQKNASSSPEIQPL